MIRGRTFIAAALVVAAVRGASCVRRRCDHRRSGGREALDHNLNLLAERFNVQVADAAILTASLRPNPVVTVEPDATRSRRSWTPGSVRTSRCSATDYVIERGGKRDRRVDQATLAKSVAELQLLNTTRSARSSTSRAPSPTCSSRS